jgi:tetratricopeptide (TPR) repeat protein/tRNA A-37 threonylcarbamoyl transferase component Bud32
VDLAASLADGSPIDWDKLEAEAGTDHRRRVLKELRLIAGMAELHRTQAEEEQSGPGAALAAFAARAAGTGPDAEAGAPPADEPPAIGHWGPFALIEKVGEGAFGEVFRARDALHRDVALKLLRQNRGSAEQIAARMLHEGRVMARVRHPNVVTVYGAEEHDGRVGLWMEFVQGRTLEALIETQGAYSAREAALIGRELCRALAATHAAGLVHRDIKARNVMREQGGRLVLMDFGAGQLRSGDSGSGIPGRVTGTPLYLAPELFEGGEATHSSDIYSLGVLLYYLVCRCYPVQATTLNDLKAAHWSGGRRRLNDVRPDLPDDFVRVVERALDPDPQKRYASAGAMQDSLTGTLAIDPWDDGGRTDARHQEPAGRRRQSDRQALTGSGGAAGTDRPFMQRWWPTLVAGAFLLGALAAALVVLNWKRTPAAATAAVEASRPLRIAVRAADPNAQGLTPLLVDQLEQDLSASQSFRVIAAAAINALRDRPSSSLLQTFEADAVLEVSAEQRDDSARGHLRIVRAGGEPLTAVTPLVAATKLRPLTEKLAELAVEQLNVSDPSWRPSLRSELPLNDPDAVQLFRKGQDLLRRGGRQDVIDAAESFREATEFEPDFVLAYAKWAEALLSIYRHNVLPASQAFPVAQDAVAQALQRDDRSGEAYAALADLYAEKERNWTRAETTFKKALSLNPSSEYARIRYAMMLSGRGRVDEAVAQILEAQRLNPRSSLLRGYAGATLHYARRYNEAAEMYESVLQLDSQYRAAYIGLCKAYTSLGRTEQAIDACQRVTETGAAEPVFVESQFVQIYADAGQKARAAERLRALLQLYEKQPNGDTAFWIALAYASLGDKDQAFAWLDKAIAARSSRLLYMRVDSRLDPLRGDVRFQERINRVESSFAAPTTS